MGALYCDTPIPSFVADQCANEQSRIISVAILRDDASVLTDQVDLTKWNADIAAGRAHVINGVRGQKPKSTAATIDGRGRLQTQTVGRNHTASYVHFDVVGNEDFYESLNTNSSHHFWYYTPGDLLWDTGDAIAMFDGDHVTVETLEDIIRWEVSVSWSSNDIPKAYDASGLSTIFNS